MSRITQKGQGNGLSIVANGAFQQSTDTSLLTLVGTRFDLSDGREVMLVRAGDALVAGKLFQDAAIVPNHQNLATTAVQAYSANGNVPATVTATLGATAATANQYAGGFLIVNDATGEGQTLRIASHPAAASAATLTLTLEDAPSTALVATTSEVSLIPPHGKDVIVMPTTITGAVAGVGLYPVTAASYGFVTTRGITSCLGDGALTVGSAISPSNSVAGAVENGVIAQGFVGNANQAGVDTEYRSVFINV